jgi:hypothetical protein
VTDVGVAAIQGGGGLERLGTSTWVAVRNGGAKGARMGPNMLASSLGGGERKVNSSPPSHIPGGSPTPWVAPRAILHYPQPHSHLEHYDDTK